MELNDTKKKNKHKERLLKVWNALTGGKKKNIKKDTIYTRSDKKKNKILIVFMGLPSSGLSDLFIRSLSAAYNIQLDDHQKNQIWFRESLTKDPSFLSIPESENTTIVATDNNIDYLSLLPPEILTRILSLTNLPDLLKISTVNKLFAQFLNEDKFWKRYLSTVLVGADLNSNYKALLRNYRDPFEEYATTTDLFKIHFRSAYEFENLQKFEEMTYFVTCVDISRYDDEEYIAYHSNIVLQHLERHGNQEEGFPIMVVFTGIDQLVNKLGGTSPDLAPKSIDQVIEDLKQRYNSNQDKFEAQYAMDEDGFVYQPYTNKRLLLELDRGDFHKVLFDCWEKFNFYTLSYVD